MAPALFTTGQSRWALQILIVLLGVLALGSSAPSIGGGERMYSGHDGDIRGVAVIIATAGLPLLITMRVLNLVLPKPWRIYLDRIEYNITTMLWVCWTSATMAFSAFILRRGMCTFKISDITLPTCPLLTFDLALLHFLSVACLALMLVILSTVLAPTYHLSLSPSAGPEELQDPEATGMFVMWDLALASPPSSPRIKPVASTYGSTQAAQEPTNPYAESNGVAKRRDKFAEGRVMSYLPLAIGSLGVVLATIWVMIETKYVRATGFILVVGILSLLFSAIFLWIHFMQRGQKSSGPWILRHDRALEVGCAGALFLLWPLSAIIYTLFPPTPNRPCQNPAASLTTPLDLPKTRTEILCLLASITISTAWLASWVILWRVLGLVFPMPDVKRLPRTDGESTSEGESLLRSNAQASEPVRPQVQYGRLVAGEAFELGDDED